MTKLQSIGTFNLGPRVRNAQDLLKSRRMYSTRFLPPTHFENPSNWLWRTWSTNVVEAQYHAFSDVSCARLHTTAGGVSLNLGSLDLGWALGQRSVPVGDFGNKSAAEYRGRNIGRSQWVHATGRGQFAKTFCSGTVESRNGSDVSGDPGWRKMSTDNVAPTRTAPLRSCKVAVIGAGAAGLVAARELLREGHSVSIYEQTERVGGVWAYDPDVETDLLGISTNRKRVHSSMYASLRTNLPREIMGYTDFPFLPRDDGDGRRFPGHAEVARYLEEFAEFYGLLDLVHFCTVVDYVGRCGSPNDTSWKVRTRPRDKAESVEEVFDAVVICNGHFSEPKLADIPGLKKWLGVQMHSHNYREPSAFTDQIVVVIGNAASGEDISREIAQVAQEVHVSGRTWRSSVNFSKPVGQRANIWRHSTIDRAHEDGSVDFKDGESISADVIVHCTGYFYDFPFLDTEGEISVEDNCVGPLYEHIFPPSLAPSLSFVGLPWKVVPFQLCELQCRWIAMALSNKVELPPAPEMMNMVQKFYSKLEASGESKHMAHNMATTQYDYDNWLAAQTGSDPVETWRIIAYDIHFKNRRENPETYRDVWPDEDLHQEAYACLKKIDKEEVDCCYPQSTVRIFRFDFQSFSLVHSSVRIAPHSHPHDYSMR